MGAERAVAGLACADSKSARRPPAQGGLSTEAKRRNRWGIKVIGLRFAKSAGTSGSDRNEVDLNFVGGRTLRKRYILTHMGKGILLILFRIFITLITHYLTYQNIEL